MKRTKKTNAFLTGFLLTNFSKSVGISDATSFLTDDKDVKRGRDAALKKKGGNKQSLRSIKSKW